jgi:hypothetical protein
MPSVPVSKENYDAVIILVGSKKANDFINEAVKEKLTKEKK